jgi:hypothetical protein
MPVPVEFKPAHIKQQASTGDGIYSEFLHSREPFQSLYSKNPWLIAPDIR